MARSGSTPCRRVRALAGAVQRREQGDQVGAGARVLDHAAAGAGRSGRTPGRPSRSASQSSTCCSSSVAAGLVTHDMPCTPRPALDQVAEHRRARGVRREVAEEAGVLPVRDAGQDDPVEVGEDRGERLAAARGPTAAAWRAPRRGGPATAPGGCRSGTSSRRSSRRPRGRAAGTARASCAAQARSPGHRIARDERAPEGPRGAPDRRTKTLGREPPREAAARSGAGGSPRQRGKGLNAAGERHVAAVAIRRTQSSKCPRCDSNAHCAGFESAPSADWGTGARRGARLPGKPSGEVAAGRRR